MKVFKPVTTASTVRSATALSSADDLRRATLMAGTCLEEGFMDFRVINFEAGELIGEKSMRYSAQLVNAGASLLGQFCQRNRSRLFVVGVLDGAHIDPLPKFLHEREQGFLRAKMCGRDVVESHRPAMFDSTLDDPTHRFPKIPVDVENRHVVAQRERPTDLFPCRSVIRQCAVHEKVGSIGGTDGFFQPIQSRAFPSTGATTREQNAAALQRRGSADLAPVNLVGKRFGRVVNRAGESRSRRVGRGVIGAKLACPIRVDDVSEPLEIFRNRFIQPPLNPRGKPRLHLSFSSGEFLIFRNAQWAFVIHSFEIVTMRSRGSTSI
ncbi:MAG: hypothetical protein ABJF10_19450 [Chthoniobacter sp.]|uniref:hypothetical protein n=1 Tax=Chthoniobacter sp. TaxID=2510640 RepID=UPI0032AD208F